MERYLTYITFFAVILILFKLSRISIKKDAAILVFGIFKPRVLFHPTFHIPFLEKYHLVELGIRTFPISFRGQESLRCRDYIRVEIMGNFYYRIKPNSSDILNIMEERNGFSLAEPNTLYKASLEKSFKDAVAEFNYLEIFSDRENFRNKIFESAKADCAGIEIIDLAIEFVEQIPLSDMNPNDEFDLKGIKTIESLLAEQIASENL